MIGSAMNVHGKEYQDADHTICHNANELPKGHKWIYGNIHCECALILHLLQKKDALSLFAYIGVSKLACHPCWEFIWSTGTGNVTLHAAQTTWPNIYSPS